MKIKTLFALVAFSSMTHAAIPEDDVSLLLGFGSYHFASRSYNEVNPAVGVKINNFDAIFVTKNSVGSPSFQLAYSIPLYEVQQTGTEFNLRMGFATGYHEGARWDHYEFTGSKVEIGDTGVMPFFTIDIHQQFTQNVYGIVAVNQDLMMFGAEYRF